MLGSAQVFFCLRPGDRGRSRSGPGLGAPPNPILPPTPGLIPARGSSGALTELVVAGDGDGSAGAGALLREVVPEAHHGGALLQHRRHLHLHRVTQPLALRGGGTVGPNWAHWANRAHAPGHSWVPIPTWLSTLSSLRVLFWYMALMMLIMPALVMKLDSMLRLCSVLFSVSISATACRSPASPRGVTRGWLPHRHLVGQRRGQGHQKLAWLVPAGSWGKETTSLGTWGHGGSRGWDSRWPRGRCCGLPPG